MKSQIHGYLSFFGGWVWLTWMYISKEAEVEFVAKGTEIFKENDSNSK